MDIGKILEEKKISKYKLSKQSGVPYSTICDILTGKSDISKCSAETLVRISHVLDIKVEDFFEIEYPEVKKSKKTSQEDSSKPEKNKKKSDMSDKSDSNKNSSKDSKKKSKTAKTDENGKTKSKKEKNTTKNTDSNPKYIELTDSTDESVINLETAGESKTKSADSSGKSNTESADAGAQKNNTYAQRREEAYKNYCADLMNKKEIMGELNFLVTYLKNNEVEILYNLNRKKESKYLLTIVDELCVKYNFPLCREYDEIRLDDIDI